MNNECFSIRPMTEDDLAQVLVWRNHPDVRRYMLTRHEISLAEHRLWFDGASQNSNRKLMVFENHGVAQGFVHFTSQREGGIADWGFYLSPDAPRGTGRELGRKALEFAFDKMGWHKVCGQALAYNAASVRLHLALGFCREGVLRDQHCDGETYHDLICFGLLRREWRATIESS